MLAVFGYLDIDAIAVAMGASYFQRLLKKKPSMMDGAQQCGWFVQAEDEAGNLRTFMRSVYGEQHTGLMVIYAVCCYIAAKLVDRISYKRQLSRCCLRSWTILWRSASRLISKRACWPSLSGNWAPSASEW